MATVSLSNVRVQLLNDGFSIINLSKKTFDSNFNLDIALKLL